MVEGGWRGGVGSAYGWVVLSWGIRPTSLALVGLRPKPRAARCYCDVSNHVLAFMPVMLVVDLSPGVLYG
jgi:hypothetical protein